MLAYSNEHLRVPNQLSHTIHLDSVDLVCAVTSTARLNDNVHSHVARVILASSGLPNFLSDSHFSDSTEARYYTEMGLELLVSHSGLSSVRKSAAGARSGFASFFFEKNIIITSRLA